MMHTEKLSEEVHTPSDMKKFIVYISLLILSLIGSDLTDFSLGIWVLNQPEESLSSYSLIWFFEAIPGVILGVFIGSFVDRWDKKKMIIYGQTVAGIGSLFLMGLYYFEQLQPWNIMIVSGIGSIASMFIFTSFFVSIRSLVPKTKLIKAQGLMTMGYSLMGMVVPILAPVLYKLVGMGIIFLIDLITFLIPLCCFILFKFVTVPVANEKFNLKDDFKVIIGFFKSNKGFISLLIIGFLVKFLYGLLEVLFSPLILDFSNEYVLGVIASFMALGGVLGGAIMSNKKKYKKPIRNVMIIDICLGGVVLLLLIQVNPYIIAGVGLFVVLLLTIQDIIKGAFSLTIIPVEIQGRLSGVASLIIGWSGPLAFLLSGFIVEWVQSFYTEKPHILDHFYGTSLTPAIITVVVISGVLISIITLIFIKKKSIENLDVLYQKKIEE